MREDYTRADLAPRDHAMLEFAEKVTLQPSTVTQQDIDRLRQAGFTDAAIVDIVYVTAWFNFIDRVADALGAEPDAWSLERLQDLAATP